MVNLANEASLLQTIEELAANGKIRDSAALTTQTNGSKLTAQEANTKIQRLIPTIQQRLRAAKLYLDAMGNMNYGSYLSGQSSSTRHQEPFIDFSDSDLHVQINVLNSDTFSLVVFIVLNGFFSNLVSVEDCVAKTINIVYDLFPKDRFSREIRKALKNKMPTGTLTAHLGTFHATGPDGKTDKTGSAFNIAKEIRNQLVHDDIAEVLFFPTLSLLGVSDRDLYFNNLFFPPNTPAKHSDTEMVTFCKYVYQETDNFADACYKIICDDLQNSGTLPV